MSPPTRPDVPPSRTVSATSAPVGDRCSRWRERGATVAISTALGAAPAAAAVRSARRAYVLVLDGCRPTR